MSNMKVPYVSVFPLLLLLIALMPVLGCAADKTTSQPSIQPWTATSLDTLPSTTSSSAQTLITTPATEPPGTLQYSLRVMT
jgi:hypothetical protein